MSLKPSNSLVNGLLTDMYQLTMAYAYWKGNRHEEHAVFETFFRKNPFHGEFTIFAGLEEVLKFVASFGFSDDDIEYLKTIFPPKTEPSFFEWLGGVDTSQIKIYAMKEGSAVFPRTPLIRIEGPLAVAQLLETTILNLTNYASLITTNAQRMRLAAGSDKVLMEFGLRRAQGPDGAVSASRYSYIGGFNATSNCLAGKLFGITPKGTHAHAFVCSFKGKEDLNSTLLDGKEFWEPVCKKREEYGYLASNISELAAFVAYAQAFPGGFLALVDTYDTLVSGIPNFICVANTLKDFGYEPIGIRLDSGDLAYLSKEARKLLKKHKLESCNIVASNDINEDVLHSLSKQGHEVDSFGIGTNLVTCQAQPALGMVYKIVECNGRPCIKLSNEFEKVTIPGKKKVYRIVGLDGIALCDLMVRGDEPPPAIGERILCQHPFLERKRCFVRPSKIIDLLDLVFEDGKLKIDLPTIDEIRSFSASQIKILREDHIRTLNPTVYKVSLSDKLHNFVKDLWSEEAPIQEFN